jgi:xylulokinase
MGERSPRWNPNARGGFIGLTMEHKREDLFRAVLEGVTMNLNIILGIFKEHEDIKEMIVIGGGAKGRVWRQILADVYGLKILKPNYLEEATSMGAAITAGVGIGVFKDFSVTDKFIRIEDVQQPTPSNQDKYRKMMDIFDSCYYALEDIFDKLSV